MNKLVEKRYLLYVLLSVFAVILYMFWTKESDIPLTDQLLAQSEQKPSIENEQEEKKENFPVILKVDVKGAVKNPGVYSVTENDRVIDVIERAGGFSKKADATKINLSQKVSDEMVIYVPQVGEEIQEMPNLINNQQTEKDGKININEADETVLQTLPGIGRAKAQAIIEYRNQNGPFQKIEDLMNVSGIGQKTFEKLADFISVH